MINPVGYTTRVADDRQVKPILPMDWLVLGREIPSLQPQFELQKVFRTYTDSDAFTPAMWIHRFSHDNNATYVYRLNYTRYNLSSSIIQITTQT